MIWMSTMRKVVLILVLVLVFQLNFVTAEKGIGIGVTVNGVEQHPLTVVPVVTYLLI
jgi:hypothetical protein